ncbi:sulfite exporter TauE/SafE family protein [Microbacterium schleiferi]|uniref:Probable membrane transporter protein n=1 Tax=Microbacterium schleiferi TaxID=69362 RepID=A0A7S8RGW3_9MICO|nr:sulfite exporter TauE/SafE family protein [Microbacterium schleiferi]QPE04826.1 sulfite exporter TauE/SafE family protein [Microbacterium schleiferi]
MPELSALAWVALATGAVVIGLSKAALPGAGTIAVVLFAAALPAKQSTGTILLLLIVGDALALLAYRRHADVRALLRLIPTVIAGILVGTLFLAFASDQWVRRTIGVILLVVIAVTLWRRWRTDDAAVPGAAAAGFYGVLGGFTTMVANAAGPVMSMYFLAARLPVQVFLGTAAWFFAAVNVAKVPFSIGLGLITPSGLLIDVILVPAVVVGALVGRRIASVISQRLFEQTVIVLTVVGAVYLLV